MSSSSNNPGSQPNSADACNSIVRSLMCHRQGGESELFSKRAIESLVKKLKEKREELDSLIAAITNNGSHPTRCVTIPRTLDGRLQVAGRKCFPHVIYARIWRWPDLHKNELRAKLDECQYSFDLKQDNVCVNPYHYIRDVTLGVDLSLLSIQQQQVQQMSGAPPPPPYNYNGGEVRNSGGGNWMNNMNNGAPSTIVYNDSNPKGLQPYKSPAPPDNQNWLPPGHPPPKPANLGSNEIWNPAIDTSGSKKTYAAHKDDNYVTQPPPSWYQNNYFPGFDESQDKKLVSNSPLPEFWCSITYFEQDVQVGESFKVKSTGSKKVTVDGYVEQNDKSRFCLGALSNVHRTEMSERARLHIGRGVELELVGEGDLWLNCQSEYALFVQSYYLDWRAGRAAGEMVHKIAKGVNLKVFDLRQCYHQMQLRARESADGSPTEHQQNAANIVVGGHLAPAISHATAASGIGIDDLRRLCILRLSFVKGWGPDYQRKSIKETPCWIEVTLHRALQLLDEFLLYPTSTSGSQTHRNPPQDDGRVIK